MQQEEQLHQAQKMESIGQLAGGIAHDFNNMLSVILGHTEIVLNKEGSTRPIYKNLQEIHNATSRSAELTRQLLGFARKQTVAPRVLDLNETVGKMLKLIRRLIGEGIELTWVPETAVLPVMVDPTQIDQILTNLCVNARDAIGTVGKIIIETGNIVFDDEYCTNH